MTVKTQITFKDFWNFYLKNFFLKPIPIIALMALTFYFVTQLIKAFQSEFDWFTFLIAFVFPFGALVFFSGFYRRLKKTFYSNKNIQEGILYTFTEDKIQTKGETFESELSWETIYQVKEVKDWFLIYQSLQVMNMVPKKDFTKDQILELRELITSNGVKATLRND